MPEFKIFFLSFDENVISNLKFKLRLFLLVYFSFDLQKLCKNYIFVLKG